MCEEGEGDILLFLTGLEVSYKGFLIEGWRPREGKILYTFELERSNFT